MTLAGEDQAHREKENAKNSRYLQASPNYLLQARKTVQ